MVNNLKIVDINKEKFNYNSYNFYIKKYKLVIIRNLFNEKEILNEVLKFRSRKIRLVKKSGGYFFGKKNFSRFDSQKIKNKFKTYSRKQYMHTFFSWNKDKAFKKIFNKLIKFRNKIFKISSTKHIFTYKNKKFVNVPKVLHYPNGGFLNKHVDYNYNNDSNLIVVASAKDRHFQKGGISYEINKNYIEIEKFLKIGDILCNDHMTKHGVKKIKLKKNQIGRFSLVLSMAQI